MLDQPDERGHNADNNWDGSHERKSKPDETVSDIVNIPSINASPGSGIPFIFGDTNAKPDVSEAAIRRYRTILDRASHAGATDRIAKARTDLGDAYVYADQAVNALRQFKRAIRTNPKRAEPHFSLAELYRRNGKTQAALYEYRVAIEFSPFNAYYHYRLGDTLSESGYNAEAVAELEIAVEIEPQDPFYHFWLADLYLIVGRIESAIAEMQQASIFSPRDGYYNLKLGILYMVANMWSEAVQAVLRSVQLEPDNALYHCVLGDIYLNLKDNMAAMKHYQLAGNLDSYDREHLRRIRYLTEFIGS